MTKRYIAALKSQITVGRASPRLVFFCLHRNMSTTPLPPTTGLFISLFPLRNRPVMSAGQIKPSGLGDVSFATTTSKRRLDSIAPFNLKSTFASFANKDFPDPIFGWQFNHGSNLFKSLPHFLNGFLRHPMYILVIALASLDFKGDAQPIRQIEIKLHLPFLGEGVRHHHAAARL